MHNSTDNQYHYSDNIENLNYFYYKNSLHSIEENSVMLRKRPKSIYPKENISECYLRVEHKSGCK